MEAKHDESLGKIHSVGCFQCRVAPVTICLNGGRVSDVELSPGQHITSAEMSEPRLGRVVSCGRVVHYV